MKAALVGINYEAEEVIGAEFFAGDSAIEDAKRFLAAIGSDFPNGEFQIMADKEAREAYAENVIAEMVGE
jgi:hypothetical protein